MGNFLKRNINKLLLFICLFFTVSTFNSFADNINDFYVRDNVGCLSHEVKEHISKINNYYETTDEKPQVVIEIIDSLDGKPI